MAYHLYTSHYEKKLHCVVIKEPFQPELSCCFHNTVRETEWSKLEELPCAVWRSTLFSCFVAPCTTGVQCGAFAYGNIAVGSSGLLSFPSCHKWSHEKIILDGNFVFFTHPQPLIFSFIFLWGNLLQRRTDKTEI